MNGEKSWRISEENSTLERKIVLLHDQKTKLKKCKLKNPSANYRLIDERRNSGGEIKDQSLPKDKQKLLIINALS
jgi:hypothetical protein